MGVVPFLLKVLCSEKKIDVVYLDLEVVRMNPEIYMVPENVLMACLLLPGIVSFVMMVVVPGCIDCCLGCCLGCCLDGAREN
jgi:hypothetical protein